MRRIYWDRARKAQDFKIKQARQRAMGLYASAAINRRPSVPAQPVYVPAKEKVQ